MKTFISLLVIAFFIQTANAEDVKASGAGELPTMVNSYALDDDVRMEAMKFSTDDLRAEYLRSVVVSNTPDTSTLQNVKRSSALFLLGAIRSTNSISLLVSNLAFQEPRHHTHPSAWALALIGEPAVPALLDTVKKTEDTKVLAPALQALIEIKGPKYTQFMLQQRSQVTPEKWKLIADYSVRG